MLPAMRTQKWLVCLIFASYICLLSNLIAADVSLAWDPSDSPGVTGYRLGYGTASGQYGTVVDVRKVTTWTVSNLAPGTYYFAVKAYDSTGLESEYSAEVSTTIVPPVDTTAPVISAVAASEVNATSATISWTTNEIADTQVEYGKTASYGSSTVLNPSLVTAHSQGLSDLEANTTYNYRVRSRDAAGNLAISGNFTFKTAAAPDDTPPVISDVVSSNVTSSSATITWRTDESADTQVEYGTTASYGLTTALNGSMATTHSQTLNGLKPNTTYHFRVKSSDAAGNAAASEDYTFTTGSGLAAAFAFEEGNGSQSTDLSGNGNTASIQYPEWTSGRYGSSLSFDGRRSYATAGTSGLPRINQPKTVLFWMYLSDRVRSTTTMLSMAGSEASLRFAYRNSQVGVIGTRDRWIMVARRPSLRSWHHFGYVFDGMQHRLYIDGVLAATSTIENADAAVTGFQIGAAIGGSQYFRGRIDDVQVYDRVLELGELRAAKDTPVAGPALDLAGQQALTAGDMETDLELVARPSVIPVIDLELAREGYRRGDVLAANAFVVGNPSNEALEVEVKTWMELPEMRPLALDMMATPDEDTTLLGPSGSQDQGVMPLMVIAGNAPAGAGEVNARLICPVTGQVLTQDLNRFEISEEPSRWRISREAHTLRREVPAIALEPDTETLEGYLFANRGTETAEVEVKVWLEAPEALIPLLSAGADGALVLPPGTAIAIDPLASVQPPSGTYMMWVRILDAASGEFLVETARELPVP